MVSKSQTFTDLVQILQELDMRQLTFNPYTQGPRMRDLVLQQGPLLFWFPEGNSRTLPAVA